MVTINYYFLPVQKLHVAMVVGDVMAQRNKENSICKAQAEVKYTIVQTSQLCAFLHFLSHSV